MKRKHNVLLRTEASQHAEISNDIYHKACLTHKDFVHYSEAYDIMMRFASRYPVYFFSLIYFIIWLAEIFLSSSLIKPIASEILGNSSSTGFVIAAILYAAIILMLTLAASENFFKSFKKNIKLAVEKEALQYPDKSHAIIEKEIKEQVKGSRLVGVLWTAALIVLTLSLAFYRNYIVNGHFFAVDTPDDWIILLIPLLMSFTLIYFGQYKHHLSDLMEYSRKKKKADKKRTELKQESHIAAHMANESEIKAQIKNENSQRSQELITCINRLNSKSFSSDDYFALSRDHILEVHVTQNGHAVKNCPIHATTMEGHVLHHLTNNEGKTTLKWHSEDSYLEAIRVNNIAIQGDQFHAGMTVEVDLNNIQRGTSSIVTTPPPTSPVPSSSATIYSIPNKSNVSTT